MTEKETLTSLEKLIAKLQFDKTDEVAEDNKSTHTYFNEIIQQQIRVIFINNEDYTDRNMYFEYILFPHSSNKSGFIFTMFGIGEKDFKKQLRLLEKNLAGIVSSFIKIKKMEII